MRPETFRGERAGRLRRVGHGEGAYWAFVPHPLPPKLSYTSSLIRLLSEADRAVGELSGLGQTMDEESANLFVAPLIRREAVLSSRIEGTRADLEELYLCEAGARVADEADVREVHNYVRALEYGLAQIKDPKGLPLSLRLLREVHSRLMEGVRGEHATPGEFRRTQNWIGPPGSTLQTATFIPPPPDDLMPALDNFEKYLHAKDEHPPLVRLAFVHYQFEAIHPFLDGNGRIGRLLIALLLVEWKLLSHPLLYLSAFFERHRQEYYDRLQAVSQEGAWEAWVEFFLRGVAEQAADTAERIKRLQALQKKWRELLRHETRSTNALRLVDMLFRKPTVTVPQVQEELGLPYRSSARTLVLRLVDLGILVPVAGQNRPRRFEARDIVQLLSVQ